MFMLDVYICIITVTAFESQIFICNLWTMKFLKILMIFKVMQADI